MKSVKVPVLITKYADQLFTSRVIDGPEADACGSTMAESFTSVKSFLRKQGMRNPDQYWPRIDRFELHHTNVRVRLFYRDEKRQFPASREIKIPVRYVLGHYVDSSVECFLCDYGIVFHCPAIRELSQMIDEAVRGRAAHIDSRELIAATPPPASELRCVRVRLSEVDDDDGPEFGILESIAQPISKQSRHRTHSLTLYRDSEINRLHDAMGHGCALLVGPPGCGKSAVAYAAALQLQKNQRELAKSEGRPMPRPLVWESSAENLISGMQYLGQWEERLEHVIGELESINGVMLISSLIDLVRLGGASPTDSLAAFLMPYVRRGELRLVAEVTNDELDAVRRLLPGWAECFKVIPIEPLPQDQTREIAQTMLTNASRNYRIDVQDNVAECVVGLFRRFMPYQVPPRGVVQFISDAIDDIRLRRGDSITANELLQRFTKLTGLPESILDDEIILPADQVRSALSASVIGQERAVDLATRVVLRIKAGLCDSTRPVATLLFCGPTGVGKTQLAKSLAAYLFGESESSSPCLMRLDMSEYSGWDAMDRLLIGADGDVADWIGKLRARPMSLLLLDEFEKASPEVHDGFLSALDEGRITDRYGRTTTLCGSIVILTSNVGSKSSAAVGFGSGDSRATMRSIEQEFRVEFLNRIDEVVLFEPLSQSDIERVVEKELQSLQRREALKRNQIRLNWDQRVVKQIASIGFDPLLGARPLQRAIEREIVAKIARYLLSEVDQTCDSHREIDLSQWIASGQAESSDRDSIG